MSYLLLASFFFVGTHVGISESPLRPALIARYGAGAYRLLYSLLAVVSLSLMIVLYARLPRFDYLWYPSPTLHFAADLVMPFALVLVTGAFLGRRPVPESYLRPGEDTEPERHGIGEARGVHRITRHPFQWGVLVWAIVHVLANGDVNSVVFFGTFAFLSGVGTLLLDRRLEASSGTAFRAVSGITSNVPFAAILDGRNRLVLGELIGPLIFGLLLYAFLLTHHQWVSGVRIH